MVQKRKAVIVQKITKGGRLDLRARVGGQKSQNTSDVHNGSPLSGHSHMKSSHGGGGWPKLNYSTDRLCECYSDKGEGVKILKILQTSCLHGPKGGCMKLMLKISLKCGYGEKWVDVRVG